MSKYFKILQNLKKKLELLKIINSKCIVDLSENIYTRQLKMNKYHSEVQELNFQKIGLEQK